MLDFVITYLKKTLDFMATSQTRALAESSQQNAATSASSPMVSVDTMTAAQNGDAQAMYEVARAFWMSKNVEEAVFWHKQAHAQGHAGSAHLLGVISRDGLVDSAPDPTKARRYFADAARFGNAMARTQLALLKLQGLGGEKDVAGAILDFENAGRKGDADAWEHLAQLAREKKELVGKQPSYYQSLASATRNKRTSRQTRVARLAARKKSDLATKNTFPKRVQVEITTRCNYACVMCPHGLAGAMQHKLDAPDAIVEAVLADIDKIESLHLTGLGEPLLADGFWKIVDALHGRETPELVFHTNGLLLTDRNIERLLAAPVQHLCLSLDAATAETYAKIRGGNFTDITTKARRLAEAVALSNRDVLLQIAMVLMAENFAEAPAFVRLAHNIGFHMVSFNHMVDYGSAGALWVVEKPSLGFRFDKQSQRILPGHPSAQACDRAVLEALDVADDIGVEVAGLKLFVDENAALHKNRPCRRFSRSFYIGDY